MAAKRYAYIYPGQGSQYIGMGEDIFEASRDLYEFKHEGEISIKKDLTRIVLEGPEEELRDTENAQPAIFILEAAITRELERAGYKPAIVAGHSVGEYAALVAADVLDYGHGLWLISQRGKLMKEAGAFSPGGMAAVLGLDDEVVEKCCRDIGPNVVVANYNCPGQVVISGDRESLDKAVEACKAAGAKRVLPLAVSGAFHSPLIRNANLTLGDNVNRVVFRDPVVPVVTNVDGKAHTSGEVIKENLLQQMESSVQWTRTMVAIRDFGVDEILEIGPGSVLSGLAKRIVPDIPVRQLGTLEQLKAFQG